MQKKGVQNGTPLFAQNTNGIHRSSIRYPILSKKASKNLLVFVFWNCFTIFSGIREDLCANCGGVSKGGGTVENGVGNILWGGTGSEGDEVLSIPDMGRP